MQERFEDKKSVLSMCEDVCFLQYTQEKTAYFRHFLHVEDIENVMLYRGVWWLQPGRYKTNPHSNAKKARGMSDAKFQKLVQEETLKKESTQSREMPKLRAFLAIIGDK